MARGLVNVSAERPHTGLGTSIVEALARQLDATVQKSGGPEGTTVSIVAGTGSGREPWTKAADLWTD